MARVLGVFTTKFGRWPEVSHPDLAARAIRGALADAGVDGAAIAGVWFGNCGLHAWGQPNVRGQVVLQGLVADGTLPANVPVVNVEAGCGTGITAFHGALREVQAGADLALAVGVEKTFLPDPRQIAALFDGALDRLAPEAWQAEYAGAAAQIGEPWAPDPSRLVLLDVAALAARHHMKTYGTTARHLAEIAAKNHVHSVGNENAQYRQPWTADAVLADKTVLDPLTRAMCAPISDGAAAVLVASDAFAAKYERSVAVRACALTGGRHRTLDEPSLAQVAADRAYAAAGLGPDDVDVAEVHDATAFAELHLTEDLRFCGVGEGGPFALSGATRIGGSKPVNPSGGLVSKGHPLAASGLAMVAECVTQLRGEAGPRQVEGARVALAHNGGGLIGFDEAACGVAIFGG